LKPLLISGFGTSISVDKRKLVVYNRLKEERLEFYPHQVDYDSIVVDGHTGNITFDAIRWLMKHDINLTFLNWNGNLLGVTLPKAPKNGRLKVMQYQAYLDTKKRYAIAEQIVSQKIAHSFNLLKELSRFYDEVKSQEVQRVFAAEKSNFATGPHTVASLMNYEGRIATFYWSMLVKVFNRLQPDFHFVNRGTKSYSWNMNAADEVNASLNYGYAILESAIKKDTNSIGFDPTVGFLHEIAQSKTPLVYDIQELFRWLIDLSVLQLLEEKKLKKSDFIVTENYHLRLKPVTSKVLLDKIRLNFNASATYKANKRYTYQNILFDNVQQLANFIVGKRNEWQITLPFMRIQRSDPLPLQKKIMTLSPSERQRLGINKSTLWYQKKHISEGRRIKVYKKILTKLR
jgi:CRISPR-associated protein Cas1